MNTELHKQWLNLTLADNFLFQKYMQNVENCKKLISEICGREVERIEYKNTEQSIDGNHTIFLNTKGQYGEISDYLKAFLKAVDGKFDSSEFSSQIRKDIDFLKTNENLEGKYMNYAEIIRDAKKEGIREGREYGTRMTKIKVIKMLPEKMDIEEIIEIGFDEALVKEVAENQNA